MKWKIHCGVINFDSFDDDDEEEEEVVVVEEELCSERRRRTIDLRIMLTSLCDLDVAGVGGDGAGTTTRLLAK